MWSKICICTHSLHAHFSARSVHSHIRTSSCSCVSHTRMAQVSVKRSLAFSLLMSHPSFAVSVRLSLPLDFPVHTFFPYLPVVKAQDMRSSARGRDVWLSGQVRPQHKIHQASARVSRLCFVSGWTVKCPRRHRHFQQQVDREPSIRRIKHPKRYQREIL